MYERKSRIVIFAAEHGFRKRLFCECFFLSSADFACSVVNCGAFAHIAHVIYARAKDVRLFACEFRAKSYYIVDADFCQIRFKESL